MKFIVEFLENLKDMFFFLIELAAVTVVLVILAFFLAPVMGIIPASIVSSGITLILWIAFHTHLGLKR